MIKKFFYLLFILAGLGIIVAGILLYWFIAVQPGTAIQNKNLQKVLAVESPVFYRDGHHKIGVFFQSAHRQYLTYSQIPMSFVKAIVAAEDHNFFSHHGVDFLGIARALMADVRAGRVVQGGSTLTQQAAKNLFKRRGRSIEGKLKELLYAWRLEYHYSKEKILEFYANQFYVSGNGRGLGVAAKYYFDKSASDLTVLESAFIAGSVKRPNYYNPFIKRDAKSAEAARKRARIRTEYVIKQMYKMRMISRSEYQRDFGRDIPFRQGKMSFALNTEMDLVKDALAEPEVEEALVRHGIDNVSTSGIRIFTSIDKDLEEHGLSALRHELSRLSVRLRGYDVKELRKVYPKVAEDYKTATPEAGCFLFGHITALNYKEPEIQVAFGKPSRSGGQADETGVVDRQGLMGLVTALVKFHKQRWSEADESDVQHFLRTLRVGDLVYVRVNDMNSAGKYQLTMEKYPELQGGVLALKDGKIAAMIGGTENRFFNRAIDAKRLMGSETKPLLYTAAIQLGWNSADLLNNQRDAFVYQNQVYIPKPDHTSPYKWVSMNWAGTKSENVASVWLLYHLCDRLSPLQFKELLAKVGLIRNENESYQRYRSRIRDKFGIVINDDSLRKLAFKNAATSLEPDLLFAGKTADYEVIRRMHYQLEAEAEEPGENDKKEVGIRQDILRRTFLNQKKLYDNLQLLRHQIEALANPRDSWLDPDLLAAGLGPDGLYYLPEGRYTFASEDPGPGWRKLGLHEIFQHWRDNGQRPQFWDNISLGGLLSAETMAQLSTTVEHEENRLDALPAYGPDILYNLRDFRVLAGLKYLIALCRQMGIKSDLQPVLSFPLGSNVISLLEIARSYETIITGNSYRIGRQGSGEALMIIDRIENSDGEVIYQPEQLVKRVVDPKTSLEVSDIMRHVVKYGTGKYAYENVRLHSTDPARNKMFNDLDLRVPLLGKTGTANEFRNSAFAGYVPGLGGNHKEMVLDGGYALAVYVGFDDNTSMTRSSTHITGAQGALPLWANLADSLLAEHISNQVDLGGLFFSAAGEIPLAYPDLGQIDISTAAGEEVVSEVDDHPLTYGGDTDKGKVIMGPDLLSFGTIGNGGKVRLSRYFKPFWRSNDDTLD